MYLFSKILMLWKIFNKLFQQYETVCKFVKKK